MLSVWLIRNQFPLQPALTAWAERLPATNCQFRKPAMTDITSSTRTSKQTGIVLGRDHAGIGSAAEIPVTPATPIVAVSPVTLSGSIDRIVELELKVTAATTGDQLPIILYSHGGGLANYLTSYLGAGPLVDFWASHGFVVIQPTHLTSKSLQLGSSTPGFPLFWESRIKDMKQIIEQLDLIEVAVPAI